MDTVDLSVRNSWLLRAFGRNPLVRSSDRIEAVLTMLAGIFIILMGSVAGAVGTAVHETQVASMTNSVAIRHQVTATVTGDSTAASDPYAGGVLTPVRWTAANVTRTAVVHSRVWQKSGDTMTIWIDDRGGKTSAPPNPVDPTVTAVVVALALWIGTATAVAGLLVLIRILFDRRRYATWQREYQRLADDDRKRRNHW